MRKTFLAFCSLAILSAIVVPVAGQEKSSMLKNGLKYLGTPYVAGTLEVGQEETLVINREQVDCTTFVEYVLAESLCKFPREAEAYEKEFADKLRRIRYRNGEIDGYTSRLHYISEWITDNVRKGIIEDITAEHGSATGVLSLSFMSEHSDLYKQLKDSPENTAKMAGYEKTLSGQTIRWTPKTEIPPVGLFWINPGDIIAFTTNIRGLDVSHIGIAIREKSELRLLHASSVKGKVVIENVSLSEQLARGKRTTGIRVVRMK